MQLSKLLLVVGTLVAIICMTYAPTILFTSTGLTINSEWTRKNFRYSFLLMVGFLAIGVAVQLALFTVALKWILAGMCLKGRLVLMYSHMVAPGTYVYTMPLRVECPVSTSFWAFFLTSLGFVPRK